MGASYILVRRMSLAIAAAVAILASLILALPVKEAEPF
jgi:hypothetical protein